MKLLQAGCAEPLKASVHAIVAGLTALCAIYNLFAFVARGRGSDRRHLAVNAALYAGLTALEIRKTREHCGASVVQHGDALADVSVIHLVRE